ncbi:mechanosensitive ion channel family protein [Candidatus Micrarchaeota archaeon]|nr:mechanosensitive ion channel family protein [Candidatus Micrarchaeota archaeon]
MLDQITTLISGLPFAAEITALVLFIILNVVFYGIYKFVYYLIGKVSKHTKTNLDDKLLECMRDPIRLLIVISATFISLSIAYSTFLLSGYSIISIYSIVLIFVGAFAVDRVMRVLIKWYKTDIAPKTSSNLDDELLPIIEKMLRVAIYVVAILMALTNLNVEITPLLAGLGIASLAVALALQDSLGNFFAGVNISVDQPLRKGDYIQTEGGIEGVVQEVGWRSTKILTLQNNFVVIPNSKLAQSVVTNYHRPNDEMVNGGVIGVSYNSDVDHVIQVIRNSIKKMSEDSDISITDAEPTVRLDSFGDFSLNFKYFYRVKNYTMRFKAIGALNRILFYEFKKEGIEIPFPVRVIYNNPIGQEEKKTTSKKPKKRK